MLRTRRAGLTPAGLLSGLVLGLLLGLLLGCMPRAESTTPITAKPADMHNSRISLDWAGVYEGVLPCADCPGIKTRLVLQRDGHFELRTQYLERQVVPQTATGRFTWNTAGSAVVLDAAGQGQSFAVGEGRLLQLNRDGSPVAWNAPNRVLQKVSGE